MDTLVFGGSDIFSSQCKHLLTNKMEKFKNRRPQSKDIFGIVLRKDEYQEIIPVKNKRLFWWEANKKYCKFRMGRDKNIIVSASEETTKKKQYM